MWHLYLVMGILAAVMTARLVHPVLRRNAQDATRRERRAAAVLTVLVPLASLGLYLLLGSPDKPAHFAVFRDYAGMEKRHYALLAERPLSILVDGNANDKGALRVLAKIHADLGNYQESEKFYARLVAILTRENDLLLPSTAILLGQTQIARAGGEVSDDAAKTFRFVLDIVPDNPLARHYLALRLARQGREEEAIEQWTALLSEGQPRAYWKEMVREELRAARKSLREKNSRP